jgi:Cu/Ag efflux pump CusA
MIDAIIRASVQQRLVVVVLCLALAILGIKTLPQVTLDAFPDVTNVQVQVATEAPGLGPEEVERFVTIPVELALTGIPGMTELRSLNRNGLSLVTVVFRDDVDTYFARQLVLERLIEARANLPEGILPVLGPVSTGLGEIFQYTLEKPDDGKAPLPEAELMRRRTIQDWEVRPLLRSIPGVAEVNSLGGFVRQYHVLAQPDRLRHYGLTVNDLADSLQQNNANTGGGLLARIRKEVPLPEGYSLVWGGQFENMQRAMGTLSIIIPVVILAILFLLFILYGSLKHALIVITVLPQASIGGILGLLIMNQYLSVPASVGFIVLWGISVINGVVLVAHIMHLRAEGMDLEAALYEGCQHRLRPVLMTAALTNIGLVPMLLTSGLGSEVQRPLAAVVVFGVLSATLLTMLFVPALYRIFETPLRRRSTGVSPNNEPWNAAQC